jgi:RHS repeat-associated protein
VLQRSEYEPYGYLLNRPMEDGPGYTGHVTDAATGLVYMQQRYYDPALGSFLSIDPIDFDPSTGVGFNRYTYTGDNPYNRIDPDGRNWFNVNDNWEWHKGSNFTGSDGTKYTSSYTHLLVLRAIGTTSTGATKFAATLLNQKSVVSKGTYFSGGNGYDRIPSGNYTIRGDIHNDNPTQVDPNSPAKNPPPAYGIQPISDTPLPDPSTGKYYDVYGAYGPIRAYLNPWNSSTPNSRGNYLHGQAASGESAHGWTHGCMCYGQNTEIITKIWNLGIRIPVTIK